MTSYPSCPAISGTPSPPPPLLMCDRTCSDGEGEKVEKDEVHGCLVIGRQLLIPCQTSPEDISSSELQRGVTGRGHLPHQREKYTAILSKQREQREHVKHVDRKGSVSHHPRPCQVQLCQRCEIIGPCDNFSCTGQE